MRSVLPLVAALLFAAAAPAWAQQKVKIATSMGDIVIELDAAKAPRSVENFLAYVKAGHYKGTVFHRVIDGFMIQAGGMDAKMVERPTRAPIPLEAGNGLSNVRGAVAMARTQQRDSATSQFFINVVDNARLDSFGGGYAVFGRVISGMEVVDKIRSVPTGDRAGHQNVPLQPITIESATLEN
jgi:peptidyl-prolyl cis-trans isomerase A (cyclophilin A)